jgi:hypothetical protein
MKLTTGLCSPLDAAPKIGGVTEAAFQFTMNAPTHEVCGVIFFYEKSGVNSKCEDVG